VAAPSANRFGHVSPTTAAAVIEELGDYLSKEDLVLDGGACDVGVESTIIDCTGAAPLVLRPGAITGAMIEECTGLKVTQSNKEIRVSGALENHYAPIAKVLLRENATAGQGLIAYSSIKTPEGVIRLASPSGDEEFARILYSALRDGDAQGLTEIVVMQPMGAGIAVAIRDRLAKAANGR
jgi:L-threonylcarbamoyladenylate synthase